MTTKLETLEAGLRNALGDNLHALTVALGEVTIVVKAANYLSVMRVLRDHSELPLEKTLNFCGVHYPAYVARAREIARVLAALPGVRVTPDPPPTNMMHVALPGDPDALLDAAAQIARDERVVLFTRVRPCDVPGHAVIELAIGEAAFALGDDELGALFARVLAAGAGVAR